MIVLIDNGHGSDTPGKCSPDQKLKEYLKSRGGWNLSGCTVVKPDTWSY